MFKRLDEIRFDLTAFRVASFADELRDLLSRSPEERHSPPWKFPSGFIMEITGDFKEFFDLMNGVHPSYKVSMPGM
jgi:hypothetical protein